MNRGFKLLKFHWRSVTAIIFLIVLFLTTFYIFLIDEHEENHSKTTLPVNFFMPERFWNGVSKATPLPNPPPSSSAKATADLRQGERTIQVALVTHHLLAGELISEIFERLKQQDVYPANGGIETVVVVGPNHYEAGAGNLQYNDTNWQTEFGMVEGINVIPTEVGIFTELKKLWKRVKILFESEPHGSTVLSSPSKESRGPAFAGMTNTKDTGINQADPKTMTNEHSVAGLVPYVAHYLPKARIFSVILKRGTTDDELEQLAGQLVGRWDNKTVLVASVDFSHYLPMPIANQKDEATRRILLEQNEQKLYALNNDYMDSPGSVALLLKVCKKLKAENFIISDHSNSAIILNDTSLQSTTSYFTGYCGKE